MRRNSKRQKMSCERAYENVNEKAKQANIYHTKATEAASHLEEELSQLFGKVTDADEQIAALEKETKEKLLKRQNELTEEEKRIQRKVWLEKKIPESETAYEKEKQSREELVASQIKATETFENAKKQKQEIVADLRFSGYREAAKKEQEIRISVKKKQEKFDSADKRYQQKSQAVSAMQGTIEGLQKAIETAETIDLPELLERQKALMGERTMFDEKMKEMHTRRKTERGHSGKYK